MKAQALNHDILRKSGYDKLYKDEYNTPRRAKGDRLMDERLLTLQMKKDRWESVESMDNWLYVFDHLPKKMRLCVDFRVQGYSNKEIAVILRCSVNCVCNHLLKAKKRFLRGENIL
jgi:hypothetical protein